MKSPQVTATPRRLSVADLEDVFHLLAANDVVSLGTVDVTRDDVVAELAREDLEAFGWYDDQRDDDRDDNRDDNGSRNDPGGQQPRLAACGWVSREADSNQVQVDLYVDPDGDDALGPVVLEHLEARAAGLAAEAGHVAARTDTGVYRQDERTARWLSAAGWAVGTTFTRMRIDLEDLEDADTAAPAPSGLTVRRVPLEDEPGLRVAHRISQESFAEHYGHVDQTWEHWRTRLTERGDDFAEVVLAASDGDDVGLLVGTRQFEPDQDAGYVRTLGVLPASRGRGVAKALLRDYFAACRAARRVAVLLHVDMANVTGALRLYESVGMGNVLEIDAWCKGMRAS